MDRRDFFRNNVFLALSGAVAGPLMAQNPGGANARPEQAKPITAPGGRTLKVGMVELDTSHSPTIAGVIAKTEGIELAAVLNRGLVYGKEYTDRFVSQYKVPHVCSDPREMVQLVDVAMIVGCNWESHVDDAEPFIAAGKPVFIDKPCVGTEADARRLMDLELRYKTPILGGSTYRYLDALQEFKRDFRKRTNKVALTVYGKINSHSRNDMYDLMYYGIHGCECMQEILGLGAVRVNYLDFYRKQHIIHVHYNDQPPVIMMLGWALGGNELSLLCDNRVEHVALTGGEATRKVLAALADSLAAGRSDRPIIEQVEACRILIAARKSSVLGRPVALAELTPEDGFDGQAFSLEYARFRSLSRQEQGVWREDER